MTCGIYQLLFPSGDFYIGSSKNVERRWYDHKKSLNDGDHDNVILQRAWVKYGSLETKLLLVCSEADLLFYEQRCMDVMQPLYNVSKIAGKVDFTPEVRAKMAAWIRTPETRAKMAAAKLGRRQTPEHRANTSAAGLGRKFTTEHRANMSKVRKGKPVHPNSRAGIEKYRATLRAQRDISSSDE